MFERLGSWTYRYRFAIVAAWLIAASWCVLFAPSLAAEGMTDQSAFLPADAPSVRAARTLEAAFPGSTSASTATLAFARAEGLTDADRAYIAETAAWITGPDAPAVIRDRVTGLATAASRPELASMLRSEDGALELMTVGLDVSTAGADASMVVAALREQLATSASAPPGLAAHVTGSAAISSDYLDAIVVGTESTTVVTVVLVVVILLLIYRAPLAALVPLITIGAAFVVSRGALGLLAAAGWKVSSLLDTFIVVLVFGVGTDYAIFLISRFREEVARADWHHASRATVRRIGAVISASAATVIVGLGSMAFADFGMIQTTGPALAVAIGVTLVAGLTLAPALLSIFGHYLFWPLHTRVGADGDPGGLFARLAGAVSRHPGLVTVALLVVLAIPAAAMGNMRTNFDVLAELPEGSDARAGFEEVATHLGRGTVVQSTGVIDSGDGDDLVTPAALARLRDVSQALAATDGVSSVTSLVSPQGDGVVPDGFRPSSQLAAMADGFRTEDGDGDAATDAVLDAGVAEGLASAGDYLALLGSAYPDVAAGRPFRAVTDDLATATEQVQEARRGSLVATQLRSLAEAATTPTATTGAPVDASVSIVGDYLDELAAAYPETASLEAFGAARNAASSLEEDPSIAAALGLSAALGSLATHFEDTLPAATMMPDSLAGTAEAKRLRAAIEATFAAIPVDLEALAATFAGRSDDVFIPTGLAGDAGTDVAEAVAAFVSDDHTATRLYLTTIEDPYSSSAFDTIQRAQTILTEAATGFGGGAVAYLGGPTAELSDVQTVLGADFQRVAAVTVLGILIVLIVLLRAIVAPLYLVGTVLLSCATALGLSTWFFQEVLGQPGVSFYLPLMVFVLLVALGSDYNIFLMSRVREEHERHPVRDAIRIASGRTGAVITSAGLILAGTFASMATAELVVLFQVGVAVALGVLIDTFLVRSILVPAITTLVGDWAWWPSGARGSIRRGWPVVISIPSPGDPSTAGPSRRRLAVAIAMIACIPMVFASLLTWSLTDPVENLDRVTAAVVNEDAGATMVAGDGTTTEVRLGEDLVEALVADSAEATFSWRATDAADAADGLVSGRYGAVLTVPADFSRTITSLEASRPETAAKAILRLATNDATSYLLGTVARSLSTAVVASTADDVTAAYVDDVLLAIDTAHGTVTGAAEEAAQLATGTTELADGASGVSAVAGELVVGLEQLAEGSSTASDGVGELAAGVARLADGTRSLANGASALDDGASLAADGASGLAAGADTLADGLAELTAATADLPAQVDALASGAAAVTSGADDVARGITELGAAIEQAATGAGELADGAAVVEDGAIALAAGTEQLSAAGTSVAAGATDIAQGAGALAGSIDDYTDAVAAIAADCVALGGSDAVCAQLAAIAAGGGAIDAGAAGLAEAADEVAAGSAGVAAAADDVAAGARTLADGTAGLASGIAASAVGLAGLTAGADALAAGGAELATGAASLATGAATIAGVAPALTSAVADAAAGANGVAGGAHDVATGVAKVADGVDSLADGARTTAAGAAAVADGTADAASGATQLTEAVDLAVEGARLVESGSASLAESGAAVATDAGSFATELEDTAAAIPTYPDEDRAVLSGVVADPIEVEGTRLNAVPTTGSGLAPYFMGVALWLGALGIFLVLPALPHASDRRGWWSATASGSLVAAGVAAAGALLMVAVLGLGVGVEMARLPELIGFTILVTLCAVAVTQALVAGFGTRGWVAALFLVVLQLTSAGAWYPVETAPAIFGILHPLLPMSHAVDGFRTLSAGGGGSLGVAMVVQVAWLLGGVLVALGIARHRAWPGSGPAGRPATVVDPGLP